MASTPRPEALLQDYPELNQYVISSVRLTGTRIGTGAYGSVVEIAIPGAICAAKKIHDFFLDATQVSGSSVRKAAARFAKECRLMSTLRHPHIVQFLGICFLPGARLPALVMERLAFNLHDMLHPDQDPDEPGAHSPLLRPTQPLSMDLKCSLLHNVASGLAFLHVRSPPVIHRDLSARNVLLTDSGKVAKIADLGVARIVPQSLSAATMTRAPGASIYMPPEALDPWHPLHDHDDDDDNVGYKKSKYGAGIDIFSFGVVAMFMLCHTFPCDLLPPTYREGGKLLGRTELERRKKYMTPIYKDLGLEHPLVKMIEACLDFPESRPDICVILSFLQLAKQATTPETQKVQPQWHAQRAQQNVSSGADLVGSMDEQAEAHLQLKLKEKDSREREEKVRRQLQNKEKEISQAESRIETYQQIIQEMRDKEVQLTQEHHIAQEKLRKKDENLSSIVADLTMQLTQFLDSFTYQVSGPGLQSATANSPTHVLVDIIDSTGKPITSDLNVTAQLEPSAQDKPTSSRSSKRSFFKKSSKKALVELKAVSVKPHSQYKVSYTTPNRGQHKLHILVNGKDIPDSPYIVTVYPDPTKLGDSVRTIANLIGPCGVAFNTHNQMIICERDCHRLAIVNQSGQIIRTLTSFHGDRLNQVKSPKGIAIDSQDNMYITTLHKLYKVTRNGELIGCVGDMSSSRGGFDDPCGVAIYNNEVYLCDQNNHCIRVFQMDLKYVRQLGAHGRGRGELDLPRDVKFDTEGRMYVAEYGNQRVQVMDTDGHFIREIGVGKLYNPSSLCIVDHNVYVSDFSSHCIVVFNTSGRYVTSFGRFGWRTDQFRYPCSITFCVDGFIYVSDSFNNRISVF